MTTMAMPLIGASTTWETIDWPKVSAHVRRLQIRIAKATKEGRFGRVKSLQWLLTHSRCAKLLAVRRVSQNKGNQTPGVDGIVWKTSQDKCEAVHSLRRHGYHPQPLRRIYIPKKNGTHRPLGIPTMKDRAFQALYTLALDPVSETLADRNSYGFRSYRSATDAIEYCFKILAKRRSPQWILEGDIRSCFDQISHQWLIDHVPMDSAILSKWLKSGFIDKHTWNPTEEGTPQGGIISPTLLIMTLQGLEAVVKHAAGPGKNVNVCIYADDFIITGVSREILEETITPSIRTFLLERGLSLAEEKTRITHINDGFDFLGFNVRKFKGKLIIRPAKSNVKEFLGRIRQTIRDHKAAKTADLIQCLNPKIRGWANYYRTVCSKKTFNTTDSRIFTALWRWAKHRHSGKSQRWIATRYFRTIGSSRWAFATTVKTPHGAPATLALLRAASIGIIRHIKIKAAATAYDPEFTEYLLARKRKYKSDDCSRVDPISLTKT